MSYILHYVFSSENKKCRKNQHWIDALFLSIPDEEVYTNDSQHDLKKYVVNVRIYIST